MNKKERENSLLNMAQADFMTGIWNRRHGEKLIEQALRDKVKGMMCIIDCDKFKSINDTYGHAVGDEVIIAIAHTLKNACRKDDIVVRLGGDEFAMFFPDATERQGTVEIFKRIFEKIEIKALGGRKIILSLGACIYDGTGDISYDTLYSKADAAMIPEQKTTGILCYGTWGCGRGFYTLTVGLNPLPVIDQMQVHRIMGADRIVGCNCVCNLPV